MLGVGAMFDNNLEHCSDSRKCDMEKEVLRAANKRLLEAAAMAHAEVATIRQEVETLVAENQRLQGLWLATHPSNRVRATRASSVAFNGNNTGMEDCVMIAEARW